MNGRDLLEAMGQVEERYVDEAENQILKRRIPLGWLSAAACLCILIGGAVFWLQPRAGSDRAPMESNGGKQESDVVVQDTLYGRAEMGVPGEEIPSIALRIDAWNEDSITATVYDRVADAERLPLGQEVTVLFDDQIWSSGSLRMPTEADFPVGSCVIVQYHSYTEENGVVSIVMTAILAADTEGTP